MALRWRWEAGEALYDGATLAYATLANNVNEPRNGVPFMRDAAQKHIGIFSGGLIWHYSNTQGAVRTDAPAAWRKRMAGAYGPTTIFFASGLGLA